MSEADADRSHGQLAAYARQRDDLLARIVGVLDTDPRVRAAWLSGSFGRGEADAWSDFDLHVAVEDDELVGFWAARHDLYAQVPPPLSPTERLASLDHQLAFFWAMAPIAVKYIGRAQRRRAVGMLGLLSGALLSLWRLLADANEPDPGLVATNRVLEPELAQRLPTLGERIDPLECLAVLRAQCAAVEQLHAALEALDVAIPSEMPAQVSRLAALAEAVLMSRRPTSPADLQW